jgi:hypothetical protein
MPEFLLEDDEDRVEFIRPDPHGFTLRTRYKGTQDVLDQNARMRRDASKDFRDRDGVTHHHVGSVPLEVYEEWTRELGRPPTAAEMIQRIQQRDFSKLKTKEVKL